MFKWTITFFVLALMAAVPGFATDMNEQAIRIARYIFFLSLGLMFLCAIIGATVKRQRDDRWE
jgi:uncharacterized membrane protein YtjA (UPF0391 family)